MDMADEDITETLIKVHVLTSRPWKISSSGGWPEMPSSTGRWLRWRQLDLFAA